MSDGLKQGMRVPRPPAPRRIACIAKPAPGFHPSRSCRESIPRFASEVWPIDPFARFKLAAPPELCERRVQCRDPRRTGPAVQRFAPAMWSPLSASKVIARNAHPLRWDPACRCLGACHDWFCSVSCQEHGPARFRLRLGPDYTKAMPFARRGAPRRECGVFHLGRRRQRSFCRRIRSASRLDSSAGHENLLKLNVVQKYIEHRSNAIYIHEHRSESGSVRADFERCS